jgi:hypothetical protein
MRQELRRNGEDMPWKDGERVRKRKLVARKFRDFIAWMMAQFRTPPADLLGRAEEKLRQTRSPPTAPELEQSRQ